MRTIGKRAILFTVLAPPVVLAMMSAAAVMIMYLGEAYKRFPKKSDALEAIAAARDRYG